MDAQGSLNQMNGSATVEPDFFSVPHPRESVVLTIERKAKRGNAMRRTNPQPEPQARGAPTAVVDVATNGRAWYAQGKEAVNE